VHQYFIPFCDHCLWQLFSGVNRCQHTGYGDVSVTLESTVSLTASADGTQWFYDQWEDDYDPDPLAPAAGSSTLSGILNAGETITFTDTVDTTNLPNPGPLQYDGRDRITLLGEPGSVTRMVYPTNVPESGSGVVLATAWEVPEVLEWNSYYIATIGEDLDFNGAREDDFDYAGLLVMAAFTDTQVYYNGSLVATLEPGTIYFVEGDHDGPGDGDGDGIRGVDSNDVITATKPIQVQSFVGGCDMLLGWSSQGYTMLPVNIWGDSYWAPVPDFTDGVGGCNIDLDGVANDDRDVDIYIHNANDFNINVTLNIAGSTYSGAVIAVPAHSTQSVLGYTNWPDLPPDANNTQAIQLVSDQTFWAVAMVDSSSSADLAPPNPLDPPNEPRINDWGYSLVPQSELASQVMIGWAPGTNAGPIPANNGNLAFVTAITNTIVYVDLNQDETPDAFDMNGDGDAADNDVYNVAVFDEPTSNLGIPLLAGQALRVGDPNDRELRGAIIFTRDLSHKIAVAWGQDACASERAEPYLDLGYTAMPIVIPVVNKEDALAVDADDSGNVSPGDTLTYTVTIRNNGFGAMSNVVLTDSLPYAYVDLTLGSIETTLPIAEPPGAEYDDGSGAFIYTPTGPPGTTDGLITAFRLNWDTLEARSAVTITFRVVIEAGVDVSEICNLAGVGSDNTNPVEVDTCRLIIQQETPTPTPTVTGTPPTATPTVTGTPPTATPTVTGTPPTATPTVTGTPPTATPTATGTPTTPSTPQEVPEPLTILLLGGGLAALAGYARRRRR
jgi:uncharacterized repeat protein (TIGR01451 family)